MGNLGCQIGYVARLRIDVRQVAHQAKRPRNVAQVVGDEGLLHEHDVEARVLDRRTKATHAHLARDDLLGSLCVALRKRKTSRRHVGHRLLAQIIHCSRQIVELLQIFRTGNQH